MKVALYPRVSTQEQAAHGSSISEQTERMKSYCSAMGWEVYKVYTDAGFSGSNMNRPALQELLRAVSNHEVDKVLVYKLDRLSRSQRDTLELIEDHFLKNGVDFVSMSENFDTGTPLGRAMIGILAVFAQLEREQIKERMMMGKEARAKKGKYAGGGNDPIGYDYRDGKLITNESEKEQIRKIYFLFLSGYSPTQITDEMNRLGFRTKYGEWKDVRVRIVLRSKLYLGYTSYRRRWTKGEHEAFITEEEYAEVQSILDDRREEFFQGKRKGSAYLTGLVVCGRCGARYQKRTTMITLKDGTKKECTYYCCNSRLKKNRQVVKDPECRNKNWRMQDLDNLVFGELRKLRFEPTDSPKESPEALEKEMKSIEKQVSRLIDLYSVGNIPADVLQEKIKILSDRSQSLGEAAQRIRDEQEDNSIQNALLTLDSVLEEGSFDDIVLVLHELIDEILIDGDDVTIRWKFT